MKGILLKDLHDNFLIGKNLASYIFALGFIAVLTLVSSVAERLFFMGVLIFPALCATSMEAPAEQDEKAAFNRLQLSFPLTHTEIVLSKYLLSFGFWLVYGALTLAYLLGCNFAYRIVPFPEAFSMWILSLVVSLILIAVINICYFLFIKKIATIFFFGFYCIYGMIIGAGFQMIDLPRFIRTNIASIGLIGFPLGLLIVALSFLISLKIYKRRSS